jgi:hypothetical protein
MGFLTPVALLFAALSIPILILYMLKLRRRDVLVSSTLLWRRLLRDREANAPWQRLRRNLLLLLQLLVLALLTLALARPFVPVPTVVSGSVVILLDASASMQARDVSPTRFDAGRQAAREIVAAMKADDTATLILVGSQPQVLASATDDRALLRRVLDGAMPTAGYADWEAAFALAAGLASAPATRVVIVSDGALSDPLPPLPGQVRFVEVGGEGNNLAITALAARGAPGGPQVFLRVANYGHVDATPLVQVSADGQLFDARRLFVPKQGIAPGSADLTLTDLPYHLQVLQARLIPGGEDGSGAAEGGGDALPLDDVAWTVHVPPASGRVLLVSEGNLFLEQALGALPGVELMRSAPGPPLPSEYDLYVYDRVVTATLPSGNLWLIGPSPSLTGDGFPIEVGGWFTATEISHVAVDDPLLRYVDLSAVHVLRARVVGPPPGARVLARAEGGPLLFVAERPGGRLAVLTFDLHDSDLPLQVAFPVLVANLADWLLPREGAQLPEGVQPGDPVPIRPDPEATEVHVIAPNGTRHTLSVGEGLPVFAATDQLGVYLVEQSVGSAAMPSISRFAVNLFDESESNIVPREVVQVGGTAVRAAAQEEEGRDEFWPWLVGVALVVFAIEWWVYWRGTGGW